MASTSTGQRRRLHIASQEGSVSKVRKFLKQGDFIDCLDTHGNTPVLLSVIEGHVNVLKVLLNEGADPIIKGIGGFSPLCGAAEKNNLEACELLLSAGADIHATNSGTADTALIIAAFHGHTDIARLLIHAGCALSKKIKKKKSAALSAAASGGHIECLTMLIEAGADINEACDYGTSLINAARKGHCHIVVELIKRGAKVDLADFDRSTALIYAAGEGHSDCVKVLVDAGANLNHGNSLDGTPLLAASQQGHHECAYLLIAAGADLSVTTPGGLNILQLASGHGHTDFIEVLLSSGADPNSAPDGHAPLEAAALMGSVKAVELLIDAGADVNWLDKRGWCVLHYPIDSLEVVKTLLARGASPKHLVKSGGSVLHSAGFYASKTSIIMALYGAGADPTIVDHHGNTAADTARICGNKDTAILLDMLAAKYRKTNGAGSEEKKDNAVAAAACDESKDTMESVMADMDDSFKSFRLGGGVTAAKRESQDEYIYEEERQQSVAAASAPCVNCGDMTVRLCSGCETTHFCTKSCEMAARHVCCG